MAFATPDNHLLLAGLSLTTIVSYQRTDLFRVPRPLLVLDLDLRIHSPYCRHHRSVLGFSTRSGQGITGVCGVFDRIAAGFWKHEIALGKALPSRISKFGHIDSSALPTEEDAGSIG